MDRKHYDRMQRTLGKGHRLPPHEFIDVPRALYSTVMGLFTDIAKLDPSGEKIKVARIWVDDGKLRVTIVGGAVGLDDIIVDAEENAASLLEGNTR